MSGPTCERTCARLGTTDLSEHVNGPTGQALGNRVVFFGTDSPVIHTYCGHSAVDWLWGTT